MIEVMKYLIVAGVVVFLAFLACLHLPNSPVRDVFLRLCHIGLTLLAAFYVVSPIDIIPEFLPPFGFIDDLAVAVAGYRSLMTAINGPAAKRPSHH